ncbi:MAG: ABC transporter permease [Acidimicrobiales bacterium]
MSRQRIVAGPLRPLVQVVAFVKKDMMVVLRQPRLLLVLVIGPFVLLLLFALGYDQQSTVLRTMFVGPPDSAYEQSIDRIAGDLGAYLTMEGYTSDRVAAERQLADGDLDLVVVFPEDPRTTVIDEGDHAVITVVHNKLDPIQQTAVQVSSQVAVQELNAVVLETIVADLQEQLRAAPEAAATPEVVDELDGQADDSTTEAIIEARDVASTIEPAVLVRPFRSETVNLLRDPISTNDYFAPAAIALLLQHMALTFSAMSLVRERNLGLFELYQVGPIGAGRILIGKYLSHLLVSGALAAALLGSVAAGIDLPFRGSLWWVAVGVVGLVTSSVMAGMVLSLVARTDTQAVQYAMLVLLAGLFFGGFLLDLDAVRYPIRAVSLVLPVTYGTRLLRDVLLRGTSPVPTDLLGLALTSVAFAAASWWLLSRRLRLA